MTTPERLLHLILRGHADKFKTVLQEELNERASVLLEQLYRTQSQNALKVDNISISEEKAIPLAIPAEKSFTFFPESTYTLKDGNVGILTNTERHMIAKLYENLNNTSNRERMVKLLSESQESFNKVLKLAKTQNKK